MKHTQAFDLLRAMLDPDNNRWWTAYGLIALTRLSKTDEGRFWAAVYWHLSRRWLGR